MACSAARLEANRRNALLSTGPRTEAGKAVSRCNALKDGFTGEGKVMPPAIKAEYDREYARWSDHYQPVGIEEESLVKILALTQSRMIPMQDEIERLGEQNRRYELDCGEGERRSSVQRWYRRLPDDPGLAVAEMIRTSIGCRWLAARWEALEFGLADGRCKWKDDDLKRIFDLIGIPADERHLSPAVHDFESLYKKIKADDADADAEAKAAAHAQLLELVAGYRRELINEADRLESGHETYIREITENGRHVDLSPAMMRLRRLDAANLRTFTRCLEQLRKLRAVAPVPVASVVPKPEPPKPEPPRPQPPAASREVPRRPGLDYRTASAAEIWKAFKAELEESVMSGLDDDVHMDIVAAAPGTRG